LLLSVGMMRTRDKLASYRVLAEAFGLLRDKAWRALLVGDGPARAEIEHLMAPFGERVRFAGVVPHAELPKVYAAADLYLWPAINEAYGMAFLEAQASGLPVVAGRTGGVPAVVSDGVTGILTPIGDAATFAAAVGHLLDRPDERVRLADGAAARVAAHHDERAAAHALAAGLALLR
jgi:glycosyltransferase involved in cell wall biosynthesis